MKHVFPTTEIPHLWAHQSQTDARNSRGNLYFRGATIYSYRDSWPLARIYTRGKMAKRHAPNIELDAHVRAGRVLVLTNSDRYSVTTASHQYSVNRAASHLPQIAVPCVESRYGAEMRRGEHSLNIKYLADSLVATHAKAGRAALVRNVEWRQEDAARIHKALADYLIYFKIRRKMPAMPSFAAALERAQRIENPDPASRDKRERASAQRREVKARREFYHVGCARTDWRLDGAFGVAKYIRSDPPMLRVNGEQIETSLGARIPLAAAPMVWNLVQRALGAGGFEPSHALGRLKLGDYPLDRIDADGTLHAGCHAIPYSELEVMARRLGLS